MNTDDIELLAAAPATAYREYLYRPHGELARWIGARFDIVARPCQPIYQPLQDGDVLLEVVLGRMSPGRCTILAARDLQLMALRRRLASGQLLLRPRGRGEYLNRCSSSRTPTETGSMRKAIARIQTHGRVRRSRKTSARACWPSTSPRARPGVLQNGTCVRTSSVTFRAPALPGKARPRASGRCQRQLRRPAACSRPPAPTSKRHGRRAMRTRCGPSSSLRPAATAVVTNRRDSG